MFLISKF